MHVDHTKTIIELKEVTFAYGNREVLDKVDLKIHRGDYLGIIGPNGGGKTTLLKLMLHLLYPQSGEITLFGKPIDTFNEWYRIGYVPQKAVAFDSNFPATVYEVVAMGRYGRRGIFHSLTRHDHTAIRKAIKEVEMEEYKDRLITDLSGGQQQRVFIARALAAEPEMIFLDEPTVGVDVNTQQQFYNLLRRLNQSLELTLILVSHDIDVIANEATEIACVNKTLIYDSNPKHFVKTSALQELYGEHLNFVLHQHS